MTSTLERGREREPQPDEDVAGGVQSFVQSAVGAGRTSVEAVANALDGPARSLTRKAVGQAFSQPHPVAERGALSRALAERPSSPILGSATATALAARVARRFGPLKFLARRTPMWLLAAAIPALHASVTRGADEIQLLASHLVRRSRAAGVEPDPERVRRAAVQVLSGEPVDPSREPNHRRLARMWLRRALRATLPMAGAVATRDPERLAAAAADVPAHTLAGPAIGPAPADQLR